MQYDQFNKKITKNFTVQNLCRTQTEKFSNPLLGRSSLLKASLLLSGIFFIQLSHIQASMVGSSGDVFDFEENHGKLLTHSNIQEQITVSGIVRDAKGLPIPGVTIQVKGTDVATSTAEDGRYVMTLKKGQSLSFRNIGYSSQEIVITKAGEQHITLISMSQDIDEVVVVGYGSQQKKDVTGSIASVSMSNVRGQAIASPDQALTGQISGVQVSTSNGTPGGGPRIRIRGIGAIGAGGSPLYVIDGFPVPSSSANAQSFDGDKSE